MIECEFCGDDGCDFCKEENNDGIVKYAVGYETQTGEHKVMVSKPVPLWYAELKVGELKATGSEAWVEFDE